MSEKKVKESKKIDKQIREAVSELDLQRDVLIKHGILMQENHILPTKVEFLTFGKMIINKDETDPRKMSYRFTWKDQVILEMSDNFQEAGNLTFVYRFAFTSPILDQDGQSQMKVAKPN